MHPADVLDDFKCASSSEFNPLLLCLQSSLVVDRPNVKSIEVFPQISLDDSFEHFDSLFLLARSFQGPHVPHKLSLLHQRLETTLLLHEALAAIGLNFLNVGHVHE